MFACVDVGTTRVKLNVYDEELNKLHFEAVKVPVVNGLQDAEQLYQAVRGLLDRSIQLGAKSAGLATYRASVLAWKDDGKPLTPIVTWMDTSAESVYHKIAPWIRLLGRIPPLDLIISPSSPLMRFLKLKELNGSMPEKRMEWSVDAYLAYRLTGRYISDATNACMTGIIDPRNLRPIDIVRSLLNLRFEMPDVVENSESIGTYNGLELNCIIADQQAASVGDGAVLPGVAKVTNGTGTFVDIPVGGFVRRGGLIPELLLRHAGTSYYGVEGYLPTTGLAVDRLLEMGVIRKYEDLDTEPYGDVFFMPALAGLVVPKAPHVRGSIHGLEMNSDARSIVTGFIDSIAFFVRMVLELSDERVELLRVSGGLSRSDQLCRRISESTGITLERKRDLEATSRGVALLQMLAKGKVSKDDIFKPKGNVLTGKGEMEKTGIEAVRSGVDIFSGGRTPALEERYQSWLKELEWLKSSKSYFRGR